jgi:hypothetical protein
MKEPDTPTWGILRNRTLKKPIEYPKQILEVLYKHYDETGNLRMELKTLRERSNVPDPYLYDALRIVAEKGWIEPGIEGQPYFTYIANNGTHSIITLSGEGVIAGEKAVQPRRQKARNWLGKHYWKIILGIVIPIVVVVIERCG